MTNKKKDKKMIKTTKKTEVPIKSPLATQQQKTNIKQT